MATMNPFERAFGLAFGFSDDRRALQAVAQLQHLQVGFLDNMAGTLNGITSEMTEIRGMHEEALAMQQELLRRQEIQQQLEEMIYQADKLIAQCTDVDSEISPSSQYFLLNGFLEAIEQQGIGTPIIKGRGNKAAFERVVKQATELSSRLRVHPEVLDAIKWAKKRDDQRRQRREKIEGKIADLEEEREQTSALRKGQATMGQVFVEFKNQVISRCWIPKKSMEIGLVIAGLIFFSPCLLLLSPVILIAILVYMLSLALQMNAKSTDANRDIDERLAEIDQQLESLKDKHLKA